LGSVKSNFGHLKGAAGAAGLLKTVLSLHTKLLPPSIHCERSNPDIDFTRTPLFVNKTLNPWEVSNGGVRRAGVSAFGFGGTNFHAVLEEYIPERLNGDRQKSVAVKAKITQMPEAHVSADALKAPLRGALAVGANTVAELKDRLRSVKEEAEAGRIPTPNTPSTRDLRLPERLVIDYADPAELADKCSRAEKAINADQA